MQTNKDNIIRVVARTIAKFDQVDKVKEILSVLRQKTVLEDGCVVYEVLQNLDNPEDFTMVEEWSDKYFLDSHFNTSHFKLAEEQLNELLQFPPDIRFYKEF
jgi:quinol monooxygenase YgiN